MYYRYMYSFLEPENLGSFREKMFLPEQHGKTRAIKKSKMINCSCSTGWKLILHWADLLTAITCLIAVKPMQICDVKFNTINHQIIVVPVVNVIDLIINIKPNRYICMPL